MMKKLPAFYVLLMLMLGFSRQLSAQTNALAFDGAGDYVSIGSPIASGTSYTKEAWVYLLNDGTTNNIASSQNSPFWFDGNKLGAGHGTNFMLVSEPGATALATWTHAAVTYDATTGIMRLYKNGALVSTATVPAYTSQPITLGAHFAGQSYLNGRLDEVRIWNRALCAAEIVNNMNGTLPNPTTQTGLLRYYQMNQGTAGGNNTAITQLTDASASAFNATLTGFALTNGSTVSNFVASSVAGSPASVYLPAEIDVQGNTVGIADGSTTASAANHTAFGTGVFTRTFTIQNTGTGTLTLSTPTFTGTHAGDFSVTTAPATSVVATGSTTFTVAFGPTGTGTRTAVLHIANNDCDEADYDFVLTATGVAGGALDFDGVDDFVSTSYSLNQSALTLEAWVKPVSAARMYAICNDQAGQHGAGFAVFNYQLEIDCHNTFISVPAGTFTSGVWSHVAVVYESTGNVRAYVNGTEVYNATPNTTWPASLNGTTFFTVGRHNAGLPLFWNGSIDEVRVWSRSLCQAEIVNNMNGALPAGQTGLAVYYKYDQGFAGANNTAITTATDASGNGYTGTLSGFAKTGATSNFIAGTVSGTAPAFVTPTASQTSTSTQTVSGSTQYTAYCNVIANVTPSGTTPVAGSITGKVTIDGSVSSYLGRAYVQRHYDIEPASNPNTATATVTLYFTQPEFTAYNAVNGADPDLPINAADAGNNKANLRITQFHGTSALGTPGTYTGWAGAGPAIIIITPTSVTWNATASRWEAVIPVTGFSGFFASGAGLSGGVPLPIEILSFSAEKKTNGDNEVKWNVASEEEGTVYTIERSADGRNFAQIAEVKGGGKSTYSTIDAQPLSGNSYYRLKISENNKVSYSGIALVRREASNGAITVSPVPATNSVRVLSSDLFMLNQTAVITDMAGREVYRFTMAADQQIDVRAWPAGVYSLKAGGAVVRIVKQ